MSRIISFEGHRPRLGLHVFVADTACVIGQVELGDEVSVWYGAVLRGDVGRIVVGARSNIQDLACLHMTGGVSHVHVGCDVTVGHGALVHGARVGDGALIGMGSILLDNAEIGEQSVVGAGAVVTPNTKIPPRSLVLGSPARVVRELSREDFEQGKVGARVYTDLAARFRDISGQEPGG